MSTKDGVAFPMQPLVWDGDRIHFKQNRIVRMLLDCGRFDMDDIDAMGFTDQEREQFAQLIGYSVCGFGDLSYVSDEAVVIADEMVDAMIEERDKMKIQEMLSGGMSIRDCFAAAALHGILAGAVRNQYVNGGSAPDSPAESAAEDAYRYADAMLSARERETPECK